MHDKAIEKKIDQEVSPSQNSATQILLELRKVHAGGVVVAVHNELIWADVFASSDLLSRYWTKLIRSYAAESVTSIEANTHTPTIKEAQQFLNLPENGQETSTGEVGLYRYRKIRAEETDTFILEGLNLEPALEVHVSKRKRKPLTSPEMRPLEFILHESPHSNSISS